MLLNKKGRLVWLRDISSERSQWSVQTQHCFTFLKHLFTFCAKLCFGLRPSQLSFGLYQLLGLSFCKKLLNNWIFQKEVKASFQGRPTILLWTQYWLEQTRKGWERRCFHGTWLYDFILKPLVSLDLFCDALVHETVIQSPT